LVQAAPLNLGSNLEGLSVVEDGVKPGERVVVRGISASERALP